MQDLKTVNRSQTSGSIPGKSNKHSAFFGFFRDLAFDSRRVNGSHQVLSLEAMPSVGERAMVPGAMVPVHCAGHILH